MNKTFWATVYLIIPVIVFLAGIILAFYSGRATAPQATVPTWIPTYSAYTPIAPTSTVIEYCHGVLIGGKLCSGQITDSPLPPTSTVQTWSCFDGVGTYTMTLPSNEHPTPEDGCTLTQPQ